MRELPRGYFIRLVVAVSVFSVIAGVIKGFMALQQPLSAATDQGVIIVFATACAAVLLFVLVGLLVREFDISQLYYPIIISRVWATSWCRCSAAWASSRASL